MEYAIAEKANNLAVHGVFDSRDRAEAFLAGAIPLYVARGYFLDKTLRADSFDVIPYAPKRRKGHKAVTGMGDAWIRYPASPIRSKRLYGRHRYG